METPVMVGRLDRHHPIPHREPSAAFADLQGHLRTAKYTKYANTHRFTPEMKMDVIRYAPFARLVRVFRVVRG